jgi:hypothetical protein
MTIALDGPNNVDCVSVMVPRRQHAQHPGVRIMSNNEVYVSHTERGCVDAHTPRAARTRPNRVDGVSDTEPRWNGRYVHTLLDVPNLPNEVDCANSMVHQSSYVHLWVDAPIR